MRVLAIYPGMDKRFNDNAHALIELNQMGVDLKIVTSQRSALKSTQSSVEFENMAGVFIHRIYRDYNEQISKPFRKYHQIQKMVKHFKPDLIFCSQQLNMPLAKRLKIDFKIPVVLLVEFAKDPVLLLGKRRAYLGIKSLAKPIAALYWRWLCHLSEAVITCNPGDRQYLTKLASLGGKPVYFVGWCNQVPEDANRNDLMRIAGRGIYAGSLLKHSFKNSDELLSTIPMILEHTPTQEFIIIGNGVLSESIEKMVRQWSGRLRHIKELTRSEVWNLIASSFYAYTPVKAGGWGFIGDSWTSQTPLVITHNGYEFTHGQDAILADPEKIYETINELYRNKQIYTEIQKGGYNRYQAFHTAKQVAAQYYKIFENCL